MQIIQNIDSNTFKLNGIRYVKNFMVIKQGIDNVSIHNVFDTRFQLLGSTPYNQISVDGVVFSSQILLINTLAPILFSKINLTNLDFFSVLGYTPYNATNPNNYISGITSNNVTTALGYVPYNSTNPNGYITGFTNTFTTGGTHSQSTGISTFRNNSGGIFNVSGYFTGITSNNVTTALGFTPYNATNPNGYITSFINTFVTGGTHSQSTGISTFRNNSGGTFTIGGYFTGITSNNVTTALGFTPYNATNPNNYISGITSNNVTTALGYTPYNSTNPNGYITAFTNTFVTGGTHSNGISTFRNNSGGTFTIGGYFTGITSSNVTTALGFTPLNSINPTYTGLLTGVGTTVVTGASQTGVVDLTQTWNTNGLPTAIKLNVTDLASAGASSLMDLQVGGVSRFTVFKDGAVTAANGFRQNVYQAAGASQGVSIRFNGTNSATTWGLLVENGGNSNVYNATSGTFNYMQLSTTTFNPTLGNCVFNGYFFGSTINQTGGANGVTRGLHINPTLTAAADFRAIEVTDGSIVLPYATATATYPIKTSDYLVNFTTGTFTATLPTAVGCTGKTYVLKNSGTGVITLATTSSQTIDGALTILLATQNSTITVVSTGANWIIKVNNQNTFIDYPETTYSGTITWTASAAPSGTANLKYRANQTGKSVTVRISGVYSVGGTNVTALQVQLPTALPTPETISGFTGDGALNVLVNGTIMGNPATTNVCYGGLFKSGLGHNIVINPQGSGGVSSSSFIINFTYLTN